MASSNPNTIVLRGNGLRSEAPAGGVITPGMLVEKDSTGAVVAQATALVVAAPNIAIENEIIGKGIDEDYAANEQVYYDTLENGAVIYGLLSAGTVAIGDPVESAGDGTFQAVTTGLPMGYAQEAAIGAAGVRCRIQLKG